MDDAGEKRGVSESFAKPLVDFDIRVKNIAVHLPAGFLDSGRKVKKRKTFRRGIAMLAEKSGSIDRRDVYPRRGAGLHTVRNKAVLDKLAGQAIGSTLPDTAAQKLPTPDEQLSGKEGPGRQNKLLTLKYLTVCRTDAANF